jgi:hypothetical protein
MTSRLVAAVLGAALLVLSSPLSAGERSPIVVELFTSQGCSSCPPADAYLAELAQRDDVLPLSLHVDYWNYIGWTDPFASKEMTRRQKHYSHALGQRYVYTPEIVVNGAAHEVGSDREGCDHLIAMAKEKRLPAPSLVLERNAAGLVVARVGAAPEDGLRDAMLWLVRFDREHVTQVARGENGGRELTNTNVVREWRQLAAWEGKPLEITLEATPGQGTAVILQRDGTVPKSEGAGPILAAAVLPPR